MSPKAIYLILKEAAAAWYDDRAQRMGAALAYYSVFSIAPLLILAIAVAGLLLGPKAATGQVVEELRGTFGDKAALAVQETLVSFDDQRTGLTATVISIITLLFGAMGAFNELQDALNTIWKVKPRPGWGIKDFFRYRFLSFLMVLATGFLLLSSLLATAFIEGVRKYLPPDLLPGDLRLWQGINSLVSFGLVTILFAMIFKILPDVRLAWKDMWAGAVITALLFSLGKFLIGLYLGRTTVSSAYGAAGSVVIILIWVYYSAQILLFGAELTRAFSLRRGK
jgi:membrane protein